MMNANVNSSLFMEVEEDIVRRIFSEKLNIEDVDNISLIGGGMFNTTYEAARGSERWIIRFGPVNRQLLMGFEHGLMEAENEVYRLCGAHHIPSPKVLVCDTSREILERDYMIVEYVPGTVMLSAALGEPQKQALYEEMGRYAARLHGITGERFGFVSRLAAGGGFYSWWECLMYEAEDILGRLQGCSGVTEEEAACLRKVFAGNRELLDAVKVPQLLHTDLWEGNVLVDTRREQPCICMVIDGDRAIYGDEDFEWAAPWLDNPAVRRGAGVDTEAFLEPQRVRRREIYRVFYYLIEGYVGIGEYNNPQQYRNGIDQALDHAEKLRRIPSMAL